MGYNYDGTILALPEIPFDYDREKLTTITALRREGKLPAELPVAVTKYSNRTVWLFDATQTKPYKYADLPNYLKKQYAINSRNVRNRCTCDICRRRYKHVNDLNRITNEDGKQIKICNDCYKN